MKDYHLQKSEKETVINVNDAEPVAYISTSQSWMKNRLRKLAEKRPDEVVIREEDEYILSVSVPKKWIRVSPPRVVSEEQRQKASERFRAYHAQRQAEEGEEEEEDLEEDESADDKFPAETDDEI